jgi:hypothetical protein
VGKKLLAVVVALVAAQVFSGCYVLRELSWDKDRVKPGETTTGTISLQGGVNPARARGLTAPQGHFFLAVAGENSAGLSFRRPTFDVKDQTGQKEKLTQDSQLFDLAFDIGGGCTNFFTRRQQGGPPGQLWRTQDPVADANKIIQAKLKAKAADSSPGGGLLAVVASGEWIDDGDGVPEDPASSDDEINCTGFSTTTLSVKAP